MQTTMTKDQTSWTRRAAQFRADRHRAFGFTLIELMIVIAIIFILVGLAAGRYDRAVQRAKEAALADDLKFMRVAIEEFTLDKQAAPQSLEDLVQAHYLREVPLDPITRQKDWHLDFEDVMLSPDQATTGLTDVHSSSGEVSPFDGRPYNTW